MKKLFLSLASALLVQFATAQGSGINLDSLNQIWTDEQADDSIRYDVGYAIVMNGFMFSDPEKAFAKANEIIAFAEKANNEIWRAEAINLQGVSFGVRGNYAQSLTYFEKSLAIYEELEYEKGIASSLANIVIIYRNLGNTKKALEASKRSLKIAERLGDKSDIAYVKFSIGNIYDEQEEHDKAIDLFEECLATFIEFNDLKGMSGAYQNLSKIYSLVKKNAKGLEYANKSLELARKTQNMQQESIVYSIIGNLHLEQDSLEKALFNFNQCLIISNKMNDDEGKAGSLYSIASVHQKLGNLSKAKEDADQSLKIAKDIGSVSVIRDCSKLLSTINEELGNTKQAFDHYKTYIQMRDSIASEEAKKGILKMEVEHEFEKQKLIAEQEAEEAARIEAEKVSRRNTIQYSGIGMGIFTLFGLVFLFGRVQLPKWAVELSVFLPFLILFEFLLVITDPYVDAWSGGEPLIKLGLNVLMAGAIFPLHSFFERFLKQRLFKRDTH